MTEVPNVHRPASTDRGLEHQPQATAPLELAARHQTPHPQPRPHLPTLRPSPKRRGTPPPRRQRSLRHQPDRPLLVVSQRRDAEGSRPSTGQAPVASTSSRTTPGDEMNQHALPIVCEECGLQDEVWLNAGEHRLPEARRLGWTKRNGLRCPRCSSRSRFAVQDFAYRNRAWGPTLVEILR